MTSTPSTQRLLDGVATWVSPRSIEHLTHRSARAQARARLFDRLLQHQRLPGDVVWVVSGDVAHHPNVGRGGDLRGPVRPGRGDGLGLVAAHVRDRRLRCWESAGDRARARAAAAAAAAADPRRRRGAPRRARARSINARGAA